LKWVNKNFMVKKLYLNSSQEPFELSRSKIELFIQCPRCFYLDRKLGISRPSIPGFTLNSAVDTLLKREFDVHRANKEAHPLMKTYGISAIPFEHEKMGEWRHNFTGVRFHYQPTNFIIFGAVDDIWINDKKELHVVDYKATSQEDEVTLEGRYKEGYKRQAEIYQWLLRENGFKVSDIAYFVYANGRKDLEAFDAKLEFRVKIIPYSGKSSWVPEKLEEIFKCLQGDEIPFPAFDCEYCAYARQVKDVE